MDKPRNNNFKGFNKGFDKKPRAPRERIVGPGLQVKVIGDDVMRAYKKLKRMTMDAGMMEEIRDRQYYQKPSFKGHQLKKDRKRRFTRERIRELENGGQQPNRSMKKLGKVIAKRGKNGLRALGLITNKRRDR